MGFAESVGGERGEAAEGLLGRRILDTAPPASLEEGLPDLRHLLGGAVVGHGAAERVRLAERESGERARRLQYLLLIEDHAVGVLESGLQRGMQELDGLFVVAAREVRPDHVGLHRARPEERDVGDDVIEASRLEAGEEAAHARALELEDPNGPRRAQQLERLLVVQRKIIEVERLAARLADDVKRLLDGGEVAQPEHVHLHQTERLHIVLVELTDDHTLGGDLERREVGDRVA